MTLDVLIVTNFLIGVSFISVPIALSWLYFHRHRDWPRSWVLLVMGIEMAACGVSRFIHAATYYYWPHFPVEVMAAADVVTAVLGVLAIGLVFWAVWEIRKIPTPKEFKELAYKAEKTARMEEEAKWSARIASLATQRLDAMRTMLSDYEKIDPVLKGRILRIVEEVK